jgi:hypothetical protein
VAVMAGIGMYTVRLFTKPEVKPVKLKTHTRMGGESKRTTNIEKRPKRIAGRSLQLATAIFHTCCMFAFLFI